MYTNHTAEEDVPHGNLWLPAEGVVTNAVHCDRKQPLRILPLITLCWDCSRAYRRIRALSCRSGSAGHRGPSGPRS